MNEIYENGVRERYGNTAAYREWTAAIICNTLCAIIWVE